MLVDDSSWRVSQPYFSHYVMRHTKRSADVLRAGTLGVVYLTGTKQSMPQKPLTVYAPLNEFGQAVWESAKSLHLKDKAARDLAFEQLLLHPGARGVTSARQLEWMLFGVVTLLLQSARESIAGQGPPDIPDRDRQVFEGVWADLMYGPRAVMADEDTRNDFTELMATWDRRKPMIDGENPLGAVWKARVAAQDVWQMAKELEDRYFLRLGGSLRKPHGADLANDKSGVCVWDVDALAYWWNRVHGKTAAKLYKFWRGRSALYAQDRLDIVAKFLKRLGKLPECAAYEGTELHSVSQFARHFWSDLSDE